MPPTGHTVRISDGKGGGALDATHACLRAMHASQAGKAEQALSCEIARSAAPLIYAALIIEGMHNVFISARKKPAFRAGGLGFGTVLLINTHSHSRLAPARHREAWCVLSCQSFFLACFFSSFSARWGSEVRSEQLRSQRSTLSLVGLYPWAKFLPLPVLSRRYWQAGTAGRCTEYLGR